MSIKRINKELIDIKKENMFKTEVINDDILKWECILKGSENTVYEKGIFRLSITFPENYPFKPPRIKFITRIFHPNINSNGNICLDILNKNWSPVLTISKILISILSLLDDPNPSDPLDPKAAELYLKDKDEFRNTAKKYIDKYC